MDNAPIHTNANIRKMIEDRGYKCVYLPPYSPFLNAIEECWGKIKGSIRRDGLTMDDNLSQRIIESSLTVTPEDCQGWIRHAIQFFERCKAGEPNL
jgi:transposase